MISSPWLGIPLTVLFTATGGYALLRWAALRSGTAVRPGDQVAELSHLLMSLAMLDMVWGYSGPIGIRGQLVVFALFGAYFLVRMLADRAGRGSPCPWAGFHLLASAAMVWMVTVMLLGEVTGGGGGHAGHAASAAGATALVAQGAHDTEGATAHSGSDAAAWTVGPTIAVAVGLLVAAAYWARRLTNKITHETGHQITEPHGATRSGQSPAPAMLSPRVEAGCHLAMSVGMAAAFLQPLLATL